MSGFFTAGINHIHPLVKLSFTLSFLITTGLAKNLAALSCAALICFVSALLSGLSFGGTLRVLKAFRFFLLFTFLIQLFMRFDGHFALPDMYAFGHSVFFTARLAVLVLFSALFAHITPQLDIVRLFYLLFTPLRIFGIKPEELSLSMLIALRFVPLLFSEGEKILDARRLRGLLPMKGERWANIAVAKASLSLVMPLFLRTFHYASQIAVTLNYRRNDVKYYKLARLRPTELLQITLIVSAAVAIYFMGRYL